MALKVGELFASFDLDASGMTGTIRTIETQLEGIGADMIRAGSTLSSMVTDPLKGFAQRAFFNPEVFRQRLSLDV